MADKRKREHGTGSISQRNDGTWTTRIQIGTQANSKPKIKAFYGKTESEVKKKLKESYDTYIHLIKEQRKEAVELLDDDE